MLSQIRYNGAGYEIPDRALRKAQISAMNRKPSAAAEQATLERRLPLQGGLPIMVDGQCVGAIGVSGGLSPQDELVAQAGIVVLGLGGGG